MNFIYKIDRPPILAAYQPIMCFADKKDAPNISSIKRAFGKFLVEICRMHCLVCYEKMQACSRCTTTVSENFTVYGMAEELKTNQKKLSKILYQFTFI